jgi:serine/threonine-protein kinase
LSLTAGTRLGPYEILGLIGAGGMGEVYEARDTHLDRTVAIKVLPTGPLADERARKRFRSEALALSTLNHPNIQTVHDFDTQDGVDFLVTEYVAGVTLSDRVADGPLPEKDVLCLGVQLAEGLAAAHAKGIVHRDLKPSNLRVTPERRLKILDFGLARRARVTSASAMTESVDETQGFFGTLPYMAPEQLRDETIDGRTDVFAVGCVLYELSTGRRAFVEPLAPRLTDAILHEPPMAPRVVHRRVSAELERIVLKCLEKNPDERYQSATELAVDLRRLETGRVAPARAPGWLGRRDRRRIAWAGIAAMAALALALSVGRWWGASIGPIRSVAVLPLENLMGEEQEYFVAGMHEALINELSKISALKVISRTSTMGYRHTDKLLPQVARELQVDGVMEGSVQREGDRVRINVKLIHGPSDQRVWAQSFDKELAGILGLQREVARVVAAEIKVTLTPQEQSLLALARPVNSEAYQEYLKGIYQFSKAPPEVRNALVHFRQAIDLDPTYAPAYVGLADTYSRLAIQGDMPARDAYPLAKAAVAKALQLDSLLAEAHTQSGILKLRFDWDWRGAEQALVVALQLQPNSTRTHLASAMHRRVMSDLDGFLSHFAAYQALDPLSAFASGGLAWALHENGRYDEAIAQAYKTLELDPRSAYAYMRLGLGYAAKGLYSEAVGACEEALRLLPQEPLVLSDCAGVYGLADKRSDAVRTFDTLVNLSARRYVDPYYVAFTAAVIFRDRAGADRTFEWLARAYGERSPSLCFLNAEPAFDSVRSDPRFQELARRMNFRN